MSKYNFYVDDVSLEAVFNKLGGVDGARRFLDDKLLLIVSRFLTWRTVKIGVHKKLETLQDSLEEFRQSDWARGILWKPEFTLSQTEKDIPLCQGTVKELTGKNRATTSELFRAIRFAGDLLPAEVAPVLRLQYLDQPRGEWLYVAMEPIKDSDGNFCLFYLVHDMDGLWLRADRADSYSVWSGSVRFTFRVRK